MWDALGTWAFGRTGPTSGSGLEVRNFSSTWLYPQSAIPLPRVGPESLHSACEGWRENLGAPLGRLRQNLLRKDSSAELDLRKPEWSRVFQVDGFASRVSDGFGTQS